MLVKWNKREYLEFLLVSVIDELNNILSGIVGYPEIILAKLPEDSKLKPSVEAIKSSGKMAADLVQDLLTISRGDAIAKEPLNINKIVADYLNSHEFKNLKQLYPAMTFKTNLDNKLLNINGSHILIRKSLIYLLSNAVEAVNASGHVIISSMNRYIDRPLKESDAVTVGEYAVLSVADDGVGISSEDPERIFDPFYTRKVMGRGGTGLGLPVVWSIVLEHNGYIDVTTDDCGTAFELYFPMDKDDFSEF